MNRFRRAPPGGFRVVMGFLSQVHVWVDTTPVSDDTTFITMMGLAAALE